MKQNLNILTSILTLAIGLALAPGRLAAQPAAHYPAGQEGIEAASLPPAGVYFRDYNCFYTASEIDNSAGKNATPPNFSTFVYANVPRVVWITDLKFLGANVGANALLPLVYQSLKVGNFNQSTFGIGDLFVDGMLSWHLQKFDFVYGCGVWTPTGDSAAPPTTRAGAGFWTSMQTFGVTYFLDDKKTWAISALNRFEINSEQRDTHITPGDVLTVDWGLSKALTKETKVGLVGYFQQKLTSDTGYGASDELSRVAAIGPEVSTLVPWIHVLASVRYGYEFVAEDRARGNAVVLTLTKRF
jgi:hypothetical protein